MLMKWVKSCQWTIYYIKAFFLNSIGATNITNIVKVNEALISTLCGKKSAQSEFLMANSVNSTQFYDTPVTERERVYVLVNGGAGLRSVNEQSPSDAWVRETRVKSFDVIRSNKYGWKQWLVKQNTT